MVVPKINSAHGSDTRNIINRAIDLINAQGKSIQDLVAKGQLTPEQYADLISIINNTADNEDMLNRLSLKRDLNAEIKLSDLHTEVKSAMTGGSVPVVGLNSVGTENIKDSSVSSSKRTRMGEIGLFFTDSTNPNGIPNIDFIKNELTIKSGNRVMSRRDTHLISEDVVVPLNMQSINQTLIFDTEIKSFKFVPTIDTSSINENSIVLMSISRRTNESEAQSIFSTFDYTVNGEIKKVNPKSIIDKSIARFKTNFIDMGKNILDNTAHKSFLIDSVGRFLKSNQPVRCAFVGSIEAGKTYTITKFQGGDRFVVGLFDKDPLNSDWPLPSLKVESLATDGTEQSYTFKNEINATHIVVYTNNESIDIPKVQVEEGAVSTEYEEYNPRVLGVDLKEKADSLISIGKNKFDGNFTPSIIVGIIPTVDISTLANAKSAIVPVEKGKDYTISKSVEGDRFRVAVVEKLPTTSNMPINAAYHFIDETIGKKTHTFNTNFMTRDFGYLVIYTNGQTSETPTIQVEEGISPTEHEEYKVLLYGRELKLNTQEDEEQGNYYFMDDVTGLYDSPDLPSVAEGESFDLRVSYHQSIYDMYDDLMRDNASYITRGLIGEDSIGNAIYYYRLNPEMIDSDVIPKRPKLILTSGVHGNEKMSVWGLVQFIKDLCENWSQKEVLEFMRWNFDLIIVPMINPSGYDLEIRKNVNGVDLNRNFPDNWTLGTDPEDVNFGGPSAASEIETQLMMGFIEEHKDALFLIDYHNFYQHDGYVMWGPTPPNSPKSKKIAMNTINTLNRKWKLKYSGFPQDNTSLGFTNTLSAPTMMLWAKNKGINSMLVESVRQVRYTPGSKYFDGVTATCATEFTGNILVTIAKSLK